MSESVFVKVDNSQAISYLNQVGESQIPYVMSRALNTLGNKIQDGIRSKMPGNFNLRRETWVKQGIYISKEERASKVNWRITIEVQDKRSFLNKFEDGGETVPMFGHKYFAIPNKKVFGNRILSKDDPLRPKNLRFNRTKKGIKGLQDTFIAKSKDGTPLILQRLPYLHAANKRQLKQIQKAQRGRDEATGNRLLYTLVKRVRVSAKLHFGDTAKEVIESNYSKIMNEVMREALKTMK